MRICKDNEDISLNKETQERVFYCSHCITMFVADKAEYKIYDDSKCDYAECTCPSCSGRVTKRIF